MPGQAPWDLVVERGEITEDLSAAEPFWNGRCLVRGETCIIEFLAGRLRLEAGSRATLSAPAPGCEDLLTALFASTGMATLLYQRGGLCLHASSVAYRGKAYLMMGPSGAGKSTVASALLKRGAELLADDVTVVTVRDGVFEASPSFPAVRLRDDSQAAVDFAGDAVGTRDPVDGKVRLRYLGGVAGRPVPIARICFLSIDPALQAPVREPERGREAVSIVQRSFFRRWLGRKVADPRELAKTSIALAERIEVVRLTRPAQGFALDELCRLVVE